ncbi:LOW QUALITY PROTEIN: beta-1,4-galactosyltransferase 6-like [Lampetra fluviatilis]
MRTLRLRNRSMVALLFLFSLSSSFLYFIYVSPGLANQYLFMVQASSIMIRNNMRTIGAQVYEQIRHGMRKNGTGNGTDYLDGYNASDYMMPTGTYLPENFTYLPHMTCPSRLPSMKGPMDVNMSETTMDNVLRSMDSPWELKPGGHWKPSDCQPLWRVAILIPFRNRHEHLPILLRHLVPMLQRQRLEFAFYLIEQAGDMPFNRAMLFNVGFVEALRDAPWDCFVFHDVDHIPESDRNYYGCSDMPRHFAHLLDKYMYILPYDEFFGGVSGLTTEQFKKINGFPNAFWGWGGEDDDLWNRVMFAGYNVTRPPGAMGRYKSIPHHNRGEVQFLGRYLLLRHSRERNAVDGISNLRYRAQRARTPLYTNITVSLSPELAPLPANY